MHKIADKIKDSNKGASPQKTSLSRRGSTHLEKKTYGDVLIEVDKKTMKSVKDIKQEANSSECRKINSTFIACRKKNKKQLMVWF